MRSYLALPVIVIASFAVGCGDSSTPTANNSGETAPIATAEDMPGFEPARPATRYDDPRQSVNDFLVAVKSGDDKTATALLTTAAQQEAWTNGMAISGEGFPDARFDVSEVEYLKDNSEAHVMSVWADKTPYGEQKSFECVWLLRQETHGWCIYGMATKFLDNVQPIVLNFENQAEMQKRQEWAEQQIVAHRQLQAHQQDAVAQNPQSPQGIQQQQAGPQATFAGQQPAMQNQPGAQGRQPVRQAAAPTQRLPQ